ncbi:hypothetical protein AXA44_32840 [Rhodococcus sp. SC4]|nr:hypothetical protein AXA44_32840 [Rhodococcus sp. SC4]KXX59260.1 hypothetical protein AZG88_42120 [Rhodococcus sp. LB1]
MPLAAGDTILENRTGDFTERFVPDGMPFVLTRSGDGLVTARRRAQFPPVATNGVEDEAVGFAEQIPALVFTLRFPGDPDYIVDVSAAGSPRVIGQLAAAFREMAEVGGSIGSRNTAYTYVQSFRMLAVYLTGAVLDSGRMDLRELTPTLLDEFESHLYSQSTLAPRSASGRFSVLVAMLRHLRETMPSALHPGMPARLRFIGRRPCPPPDSKLDAYSPDTAAALRAACREHLRHAVQRLTVEGEEVLARGEDPRTGGWTVEETRCGRSTVVASCANRMSWRAWVLSIAPRQDSGFADYTRCCTRTKPISPRLRYCSSSIPDSSRKQYAVFIPTACATHLLDMSRSTTSSAADTARNIPNSEYAMATPPHRAG